MVSFVSGCRVINDVLLSFPNLLIIPERSEDRVFELLTGVLGNLSEDLVARQAKILDQSLEKLAVGVFA